MLCCGQCLNPRAVVRIIPKFLFNFSGRYKHEIQSLTGNMKRLVLIDVEVVVILLRQNSFVLGQISR